MIDQELLSQKKQSFLDSLNVCANLEDMEILKSEQLGKNGIITVRYKELAGLDIDGKKVFGPLISDYKSFIEEQLDIKVRKLRSESIDSELAQELVDYSIGLSTSYGHHNLIQKELARMYSIFTKY